MTMTSGPIDLDRSTSTRSGRGACATGRSRSSASPGAGSRWRASFADAGARVTVYDGAPADELATAIAASAGGR
jgi:hypothetical protein